MIAADSTPDIRLSLLNSVLKAVKVGTIVLDSEQRVVLWNHWIAQHSRYSAEVALGKKFDELFPELKEGRIQTAIHGALKNNFASLLSQTLHKAPFPLFANAADSAAGLRLKQAVQVMPIEVANLGRHCLVQITDVSTAVARERQLREKSRELEEQTFTDGLTGIANRRCFDAHLADEFRRAKREEKPIALIMLDVDYFKNYNDNYGHRRGDQTLTEVATAFASVVRRSGDLLARYGGEEFAVILPNTDSVGALAIAESMRQKIEEIALPHAHSDIAAHVTVSLGVSAVIPDIGAEASTLLDAADRALYQAKRAGRNRVVEYKDNMKSKDA